MYECVCVCVNWRHEPDQHQPLLTQQPLTLPARPIFGQSECLITHKFVIAHDYAQIIRTLKLLYGHEGSQGSSTICETAQGNHRHRFNFDITNNITLLYIGVNGLMKMILRVFRHIISKCCVLTLVNWLSIGFVFRDAVRR